MWNTTQGMMRTDTEEIQAAIGWCVAYEEVEKSGNELIIMNLTLLQSIRFDGLQLYTSCHKLCITLGIDEPHLMSS